ncbi:GNAT family N-acetyltransferase [Oceaniglobus indicus]|uniref:GNAT family N-acetyltransferase n=1 Tax=Oceaniglobus indicus TaxID=2047749 RepID=UPI000C1A0557|nr:GNAT family N-acyltransferase [Oceaniglobus indicus]
MSILQKGSLVARQATTPADVAAALALRSRCFRGGRGDDRDDIDSRCIHILLENTTTGRLVCCYRILHLDGAHIADSYAARYYDLDCLAAYPGPMAELGRFCVAPDTRDPDVLRVAWGALTRLVDRAGVRLLFGCTSFAGTDARPYADAFALLAARYQGPRQWTPRARSRAIVPLMSGTPFETGAARATLPPLLRTYLLMGGWIGDHAVIDHDLDTLHVFTGLEIANVPVTRARLLRAVAY